MSGGGLGPFKRGCIRSPVGGAVVALLLAHLNASCGNVVSFERRTAASSDATEIDASGRGWYAPEIVDLGGISSSYTTTALGLQQDTVRDFELRANDSSAMLALAARSDATTLAVVRRYIPYAESGTGWEALGGASTLIDTAFVPFSVFLGYSADGEAIAGFWDSTGTAQKTIYMDAGGDWRDPRTTAAEVSPYSGLSLGVIPTFAAGAQFLSLPRTQAEILDGAVRNWDDRRFPYGRAFAATWDPFGNAYLARPHQEGTEHATLSQRYTPDSGWSVLQTAGEIESGLYLGSTLQTSYAQGELLNDGFGVTVLTRTEIDSPVASSVKEARILTQWIVGNDVIQGPEDGISGTNPQVFGAAADGDGNVLVVFYDQMPSVTCSTDVEIAAERCDYRLYAAFRGADGVWAGPSRIDVNLTPTLTTFYQSEYSDSEVGSASEVQGGVPFARPGVAALGGGKFVVLYSGTDLQTQEGFTRVLSFSAGTGWDWANEAMLDSRCLIGDVSDCAADTLDLSYRPVNEISVAYDRHGEAFFVLQEVIPEADLTDPTVRRLGYRGVRYSSSGGGWVLDSSAADVKFTWLNSLHGLSIPGCRMAAAVAGYDLPSCNRWPAQAAIFPSGEAVLVFPAPSQERASAGSSPLTPSDPDYENIELYSVGYR